MTRFNVTHLAVLDDKALITIEFQPWMRHFFWLISVGCFSFTLFWFYARVEVLGSAYLLGGIFLAALPSYKVETVIDRLSESVIHTTRFFGSKRQTQFPLGVSSLLAKIYSNSKGRYTNVFLVSNGKKYKVAELMSSVTDTVNDPVLDEFVGKLQAFITLPYEKAF